MRFFSFRLAAASLLGFAAAGTLRADDHVEWVQVHADISYDRTGTTSTTTDGTFSYKLTASLDQLMVRVAPGRGEKWPSYVLLEEYPRVGKISGSLHFSGSASMEKFSATASLDGTLSSLDSLWIDSIKTQSILGPGLNAEIMVAAKLAGNVTSNLPGAGSDPKSAIFIWPSPIQYREEAGSFITEGSLNLRTPFGPRPMDPQIATLYDMTKTAAEMNLPGLGGLTAPSVGAVLTGTPEQWELSLNREVKTEVVEPTQPYTHHVKIKLRLVPETLPIPTPMPQP